jgi:AcrR family transcriptional regulator
VLYFSNNAVIESQVGFEMMDSKTKILNAASELFEQGGAKALSVRAISGRAGLSTIGIYNHFNGKQGILDALYIEGFELVMDAMNVKDKTLSPRDTVLKALSNYVNMAREHTGHYRLIFGSGEPGYKPSEVARAVGAKGFDYLTQIIGPAIPQVSSTKQRREIALQIWALAHGYISLKDHEATELIPSAGWKDLIMRAVETHLDALIKKYS